MKKLSWQQWVGIGLLAAVVITGVVLHFVQPQVSYAFTEAMTAGGVAVGVLTGWMLKAKNIINGANTEK